MSPTAHPLRASLATLFTVVLASACGSGGVDAPGQVPGGELLARSDGTFFVSDAHFGGDATSVHLAGMTYGRLVDVYDSRVDPTNPGQTIEALRLPNLLIGQDVNSNGIDYVLSANPVTQRERLVILAPAGTQQFAALLAQATENLTPVLTRGFLGASAAPPFTGVPRNAALSIRFTDLMDPATISAASVQVVVGDPPSVPYELRVIPDPSHGGLVDGAFHTTRVLLDFSISGFEAQQSGGKLEPNPLGLPAATQINAPNLGLRIPTVLAFGQYGRLENLSGHGVSAQDNGPVDLSSATVDVLRGMRSQGKTEVTGDPNNGFLPDDLPPSILGSQGVNLTSLAPVPGVAEEYLADLEFASPNCAMAAVIGDVLQMPGGVLAEVVAAGQLSVGTSTILGARLRRLGNTSGKFQTGQGVLRVAWSPDRGAPAECFVRFDPLPGAQPSADVSTKSSVIIAFSEPMDPASVQALDTFTVTYETPPSANPMWSNVVGSIRPSSDLREFEFEPSVPLRHLQGSSETYIVDVVGDDPDTGVGGVAMVEGIIDLAGNPLTHDLTSRYGDPDGALEFQIDPQEPTRVSAGIAFRFASVDEDQNGAPELRGQFLIKTAERVLGPRSVSRFSAVVDDKQAMIGAMPLSPLPVVTPLSNFGSKTQALWRYVDMGYGLLDDNTHNIDVEGLWWSPFDPSVQQDTFQQFRVALAHASALPDEGTGPGLLPKYVNSGLQTEFALNVFDQLSVVTQPAQSYFINPGLSQTTSTGLKIFPWPVNVNVQTKNYNYWTWRDTAKTGVSGRTGAGAGIGADPNSLTQTVGVSLEGFYPQGELPTIALPLLMEFRTSPDDAAFSLNGFKTSFALLNSPFPAFRAFSTGGVAGANIITVNPNSNPVAQGGVNPANGQQTNPIDNTVYWGQADFVVRVSRVHTIWLDTGAPHSFGEVVLEPELSTQPSDTHVSVAFRGASSITSGGGLPWESALNLDPYGNSYTPGQVALLGGMASDSFDVLHAPDPADDEWKASLAEVNDSRYVQMRISFLSNPESNLSPEISTLGFGFIQ